MVSRAGGLLVLDRPQRAACVRSGLSRRIVLAGVLAGVGVLTAFAAGPGHSSSSALHVNA
jgi:hypothetical protein